MKLDAAVLIDSPRVLPKRPCLKFDGVMIPNLPDIV